MLQQRREALIRQAARQRAALHLEIKQLETPIRIADTAIHLTQIVRRHNWMIALATTILGAVLFGKPKDPAAKRSTLSKIWNGARLAYSFYQKFRSF